jgi:hypothetical protein
MVAGRKNVCGRILLDLGYERVAAFRKAPRVAVVATGPVDLA